MSATEATSILQRRAYDGEAEASEFAFLRTLIWCYFLLLLFEGAMRKWWFPGLSQGLLIVRDPIVIWIYFLAYTKGIFPFENKYIQRVFFWTIVAVAFSVVINKAHVFTISYGARTNILHFPLIFVMGRILSRKGVLLFGRTFLFLALPMTWIVAEQFQADRDDILNVAAGGMGYQLETSGGKVRASGTFTFVSGIVFYYCFVMAFVIYGFLKKGVFPKWLLYLGASATFLAMVTAGSRAVIAESLQVVACFGFLAYFRPHEFGRITASVFGLSAIGLVLYSQIDLFKVGLNFLSLRFEEAASVRETPLRLTSIVTGKLLAHLIITRFSPTPLGMDWEPQPEPGLPWAQDWEEPRFPGLVQLPKTAPSWESSSWHGESGWPRGCSIFPLMQSSEAITWPFFFSAQPDR